MKSLFLKSLLVAAMYGIISYTVSGIHAEEFGLKPLFLQPNKCSSWVMGGHLESGLYVNEYGQKNMYDNDDGLESISGNTALLQNVHQSDLQLNQLGVFFGKELNTRCGWDIGGRVDYIYGTDARFVQSTGLEKKAGHGRWGTGDYYSAMAQMYLEAGYKNVSVKFGKFLSPIGNESFISDQRFFYSLSRSYLLVPKTHTGALVTWNLNKKLSVFGGWTQGENEYFESSDNNAFLGGLELQINPRTKWGYAFLSGKNKYVPDQTDPTLNYFAHSLYMTHHFNERWDYTFEWSLRNYVEKVNTPGFVARDAYGMYSIEQALYYKINCKLALGLRLDWAHDVMDLYGITFGANWKPRSWLLIRPEIRYDDIHGGNSAKLFNWYNEPASSQLSGGFSTVVRF